MDVSHAHFGGFAVVCPIQLWVEGALMLNYLFFEP